MRLDKYLQITGLIKRRTLANEACKLGLIKVNQVTAKPTKEVTVGDQIDISLARRDLSIKILKNVSGNSLKKSLRTEYFEILRDVEKQPDQNDAFWSDDE